MCRRNQLLGWILLAFGLGLLIGLCMESCLLSALAGFGLTLFGFRLVCQR